MSPRTVPPRILAMLGVGALPFSAIAAIELGTVDGSVSLEGTSTITNYFGPQDLGDVNGDGFDDLGESNGNGFCVYYGSADLLSDGSSDCISLTTQPRALKGIGDHNGDGYADLMVYGHDGLDLEIYNGSADGIETTPLVSTTARNLLGSTDVYDIVAGDLDQDGFDDLVLQSIYFPVVMWGPHTFGTDGKATSTTWRASSEALFAPVRLAEGDFDYDQDGYPDLIFMAGSRVIGIHAGSATQSIATAPTLTLDMPSGAVSSVYTGDFDGNGWDDIIAHNGANRVFVAYNQGGGVFEWSDQRTTGINFAYGNGQTYQAMDLDGDGYDDLVRYAHSNLGYQVGWGGPEGLADTNEWFTMPDGVEDGTWGMGVGVGDFDGDGDTEAVVRSGDRVYWSVGGGTTDTDGDGVCDATDVVDTDSDGIADDCDAFPSDSSETTDSDGDGVGDNSDAFPTDSSETADSDGDGVGDNSDAFPDDGSESTDADGDGVGDNSDAFPYDSSETADSDGDGVGDNADLFPHDANETGDADGDGIGDNSDPCEGFPNDDTDADGVCDTSDICPTDATDADEDNDQVCDVVDICVGTDNVDSDGDQICDSDDLCEGNDATGDEDGDLICDGSDNCPADANADQADADADDIGDACESDSDTDGTIDDDDNCPEDANADQSDIDLDGAGDVCDLDDDGDGVTDEVDNCPFYANADQADLDGDGYGDECDGDDDADGIADDTDLCPGTPLDAAFDSTGCSGEQRIEAECGEPNDYGWSRRGRYIACVAKEARSAKRAGLITHRQKARLIRQATLDVWISYVLRLLRWR